MHVQNYYSVPFSVCVLCLKKNYIKKERKNEIIQAQVCEAQIQVRSGRESIGEDGDQGELEQRQKEEMQLACMRD